MYFKSTINFGRHYEIRWLQFISYHNTNYVNAFDTFENWCGNLVHTKAVRLTWHKYFLVLFMPLLWLKYLAQIFFFFCLCLCCGREGEGPKKVFVWHWWFSPGILLHNRVHSVSQSLSYLSSLKIGVFWDTALCGPYLGQYQYQKKVADINGVILSVRWQYLLQGKIHEKTPTSPLWPWWNGPPTRADVSVSEWGLPRIRRPRYFHFYKEMAQQLL